MAKTKRKTRPAATKEDKEVLIYIYALLIITLSIIGLLNIGIVGEFLNQIVRYFFGSLYGVVYAGIIFSAVMLMLRHDLKKIKLRPAFGAICLFCAWLLQTSAPQDTSITGMAIFSEYVKNSFAIFRGQLPTTVGNGGLIGAFLYSLSTLLFDKIGTLIFSVALLLLGVLMFANNKYVQVFFKHCTSLGKLIMMKLKRNKASAKPKKVKTVKVMEDQEEFDMDVLNANQNQSKFDFLDLESDDFNNREESIPEVHEEVLVEPIKAESLEVMDPVDHDVLKSVDIPVVNEKTESEEFVSVFEEDYTNYKLPRITLLNKNSKGTRSSVNIKAAKESGDKLMRILDEFGVKATLMETHIGPSVTKFEVKPDLGVRVSKISNLQHDIKMGLAAKDIRIEAPIPSKSAVGIEIPNIEKTTVGMKELMKNVPEKYADSKLLFGLGKDLLGNCVYGELNKMPHLLIAGATGSGKSVCVNSIIVSILMRAKPDEVKLLLIDPKKVEFTMYAQVPHLLGPVITDGAEASTALKVIVNTMDNRYELFSQAGVRNISGYNKYIEEHPEDGLKKMPWIVVVIDELADLMLVAAKDVEASIQRITQLARAAGIHLIVATQRPSVDVITGIIKANIPSRIAFAVSSAIDSRTILDQQGAEKLLGMGDMLYIPVGEQVVTRVQGVFVSDEEVRKVCDFVTSQARPKFDDAFIRLQLIDSGSGLIDSSDDPLYDEVRNFVIQSQKASTSFIQRKFSIGYSRAARLVDVLEENGVVGPARGSKPREVYIKKERTDSDE